MTAVGAGAEPFAYISNLSSNNVTVIDGTTVLTPPTGIPVGAQPLGVAVNPAGTRAYVVNSNMFETGVPSVSVIDTASLSVVATITAGITGQPSGVAVSDDGSLVYVANNNGTVAVIDAATNTVVNTLSPPPGQSRQLAAIVVAGGSVWATDLSTGEVLNVTDNTMPGLFVSFGMMGIAANPSGSRLYVSYGEAADGNLKIAIIDVATSFAQQSFTSRQISTTGMDSGSNPGGIAVSPSGAFVYAPVLSENRLAVMNTSNNSVLPLILVGPAPFGVAVDPMGTRVYVGVSGNRTVTVLNAATNTILQTGMPVGTNPMGFGSFVAGARPAPPPPQFALTVQTAGNGFGSVMANPMPTNGTYAAGTVVALTATPNSSSQFAGWSGVCSGTGACSVTMDAAKSVTATFTLKQYALSVSMGGNGSGTVSPSGGMYNHGTIVSLTATPGSGSQFSSWSGCSGSGNACSVTMDAAKSVTATFTATAPPPPAQFTLTLDTVGSGSVSAQPPATVAASSSIAARPLAISGRYNAGTVVAVTATAAPGFKFTGWSGGCTGTGACSVTMNADKSVTASFTAASEPPATCDVKIKDWQKKVADHKHPWWHNYKLRMSLKMYAEALDELGRAKAKVGNRDKRYLHAEKEFNDGKSALCHGHYWRADNEFWDAFQIARQIVKQSRR